MWKIRTCVSQTKRGGACFLNAKRTKERKRNRNYWEIEETIGQDTKAKSRQAAREGKESDTKLTEKNNEEKRKGRVKEAKVYFPLGICVSLTFQLSLKSTSLLQFHLLNYLKSPIIVKLKCHGLQSSKMLICSPESPKIITLHSKQSRFMSSREWSGDFWSLWGHEQWKKLVTVLQLNTVLKYFT